MVAIEAHKVAAAANVAAHKRYSVFENELADNERLQRDRRLADETRLGEEIETAINEASHFEEVAAYALLDIDPTTMAGLVALLTYAIDHDDANHGIGWPEAIGLAEEPGTRSWQYFVIDKLASVLPKYAGVGMTAIQITSIKGPPEGCELWSGGAIKNGASLRWFIELDGSSPYVMEEDVRCRHIDKDGDWRYCFMKIDPPEGTKEAILTAIRGALS
jgi:hypothetical protein